MNQCLNFQIEEFTDQGLGYTREYDFSGPVALEGIKILSDLEGHLQLMLTDVGIDVTIKDLEVTVELPCAYGGDPVAKEIKIPQIQRLFLFKKPKEEEDLYDIYLLDMENISIDLTELLRQEIILHFPIIAVSSKGCETTEKYLSQSEEPEYKPFAKLKDLI